MTSRVYVATAGDDIRFWQENEQTVLLRLSPIRGPVASLDWSENGLQLIACGQESQPPAIVSISSDLKTAPSVTTTTLSDLPGHASVVSFGHDSANPCIGVGYDGGKIAIVNSKTLEITKTLAPTEGKRTVMSLCFDSSDTRLAASDDAGNIIVHNVIQAIHGKPLPQADGAIVRQVKFSPWKKGLLASCADSGSITLWDVFKSQKVHSFSQTHSMPVTGVAFSPLNDMLLLSAGLDKQFCCLDYRKNQVVKTIPTDSALCSLDFHHEGWAVGLGTTRGRLLIYDLRQTSRPIREIAAHQTSVQTVKFATKACSLTTAHLQPKNSVSSPTQSRLTVKSSKTSSAISPLCANENTRSVAPGTGTSSPDRLASFYMRPETAVKTGEYNELNQKTRLLQAQRLLNNQTPLISAASYDRQIADAENIFRSQSVDLLTPRLRMEETFRSTTTDVRNLSPVSTREVGIGGSITRSEFNIPNALNRPFPTAASTPFHPTVLAQNAPVSTGLSSISTIHSRLTDSGRHEFSSSYVSAASRVANALPVPTEDSWSPSPEPRSHSATLREQDGCDAHTQTLVVGDFPPLASQQDASTQTEGDLTSTSMSLREIADLLSEHLDPVDEKLRRLANHFISLMCDQTAELRRTMQEELSPNVELQREIERLKAENEQLRQTVVAYDAKLFNSTLRL